MKNKTQKRKSFKDEKFVQEFKYTYIGMSSLNGDSIEKIAETARMTPDEVREGLRVFCSWEPNKYRLQHKGYINTVIDWKSRTKVVTHQRLITGIFEVKPQERKKQGEV